MKTSTNVSDEVAEFQRIVIVGGGIAGLATALALQRVGLKSVVLERADSLRVTGAALSLWTNAWRALDVLGVADSLRQEHPLLECARVTSVPSGLTKELSYRGIGKCGGHEVRCVRRRALLETLAKELPAGTIRFNSKVGSIQQCTNSPFLMIGLSDGAFIKAEVLIGCDGVNSVVAEWLGLQSARLSGRSAIRGLSTWPKGHHLEAKVQQYWGDGLKAGFLPCNDKDVYWFTTQGSLSRDAEIGRDPKLILEEALKRLGDFPEQMVEIVKKADVESLTLTPLCLRWPWMVWVGRLCKGNVSVAGDAMHPMTPDLGQGGCAALEDAVVLARCLGEAMPISDGTAHLQPTRIEKALKKYVEQRRWRAVGLISGAYLTGLMQQGSGGFMTRLLRDTFLSKKLSENLLNQADFDCGTLPPSSSCSSPCTSSYSVSFCSHAHR